MMVLPLGIVSVVGTGAAEAAPVVHALQASPSGASALPLSSSAQTSAENAVTSFLAAHPAPLAPTDPTAAQTATFYTEWNAYLKIVPWSSLYGQWGCTLKKVSINSSTSTTAPTFGTISNCGGVEALTPLVGTIATRSSTLASPAGASARSLYPSTTAAVTPLADQKHCSHQASTYLCIVWNTSNGVVAADAEWEGSGHTPAPAHSRLGNTPGASCGLGTFVANSPTAVLAPGDLVSASTIQLSNADWSDRFYDTALYSKYCAVNA